MARYSSVTTNFSGGLISDHLVGRIDLDRAANSARKCTNFFPTVQGPAEYRPGLEYIAEETLSSMTNTVSTSIVLNEDVSYRVVFGAAKLKIFDNSGDLIDTLTTPYSQADLKGLRFSSETDRLYITHPNHRPKILTAALDFVSSPLLDSAGATLTSSDGFILTTTVQAVGAVLGDWSLTDISTKVEPFLEPDTSDNVLRVTKGEEIAKIVSTDSDLAEIVAASPTDQVNYYIQYDLKGKNVLGRVIRDSLEYDEVGPPSTSVGGVHTIYVDAVDFVSEVTAPNAKLYLLDNVETVTGSVAETQLKQEGVPIGEVHLRSDIDIFSNANVGTWIKVDEDKRSDKTIFGRDAKFGLTRWLKISEYVGIESHPTEFYAGSQFIEEPGQTHDYSIYDSGGVYKAYGNSQFIVEDSIGLTAGDVRIDGNRVFTWAGGAFRGEIFKVQQEQHADGAQYIVYQSHTLRFIIPSGHGISEGQTVNISGLTFNTNDDNLNGNQTVDEVGYDYIQFNFTADQLSHAPTGEATLTVYDHDNGTTPIVGDLSKSKSFEVVKCDTSLLVEEYHASLNPNGKLIKTTVAATTVTEIANDIILTATLPIFNDTNSVGRHIKGVMPSGMVYAKILEYNNTKSVRARLNNTVPRDGVTGGYENNGIFQEFSLGAWYTNNYPKTVARYEQRRVFGGTNANPNFIFFSRINDEEDYAPTQDDKLVLDTDGISYGISNVNAAITWLSAGTDLLIGTSAGLFRLVTNQFNAAVSPKTIRIELVDEVGCDKDPVLSGTSLFFPDDSATELLEFKFDSDIQSGTTDDVAKFVYPTFVKDRIKKVEFQNNPQPRLWVVTESGELYVLTYHRQESFYAWSKHDTDGIVIDVTVLRKGYASGVDQVWLTIKRDLNYFYERLFSEVDSTTEPTFYLDNATKFNSFNIEQYWDETYLYIPATGRTVGETVAVVVDKVYLGEYSFENITAMFTGVGLKIPYKRSSGVVSVAFGKRYTGTIQMMYPTWSAPDKPAYGVQESRIISQKVFTVDSVKFKHGISGQHDAIKLPGITIPTNPELGTLTPYTGFDRERPVRNSQFGVEKLPELVQDEPYKTIFGSLVTKTDLN